MKYKPINAMWGQKLFFYYLGTITCWRVIRKLTGKAIVQKKYIM
jgi:hypothetical protein